MRRRVPGNHDERISGGRKGGLALMNVCAKVLLGFWSGLARLYTGLSDLEVMTHAFCRRLTSSNFHW